MVTIISARYEWLTLPIALVLLTLVLLLATIIKSQRHGIHAWKSSSLALLSGPDQGTRDHLGQLGDKDILMSRARNVRAVLGVDGEYWSVGVVRDE